MVARISTVAFSGIDVLPISAEVHIANGLPAFTIVGLPDKAVGESKERVRAAMNSVGLALPSKRITVNLAPADVIKEGSHFDLPIAVGILCAMGVLPPERLENVCVMGELGLDGRIAAVAGVLPAAVAATGRNESFVCPKIQGSEAAWSGNSDIAAVETLSELILHFKEGLPLPAPVAGKIDAPAAFADMREIKGQENAKRAAEIAAAGGHNLLMIGPPGSGKSMLAARLPGLLPPMTTKEILEVSMIHSVAGLLRDGRLITERPFRSPHHSASMPALIGGGQKARPGEVSLAHKGVLFLDELPEFSRAALDSLRQPLETGEVSVARVSMHVTYPAQFQLIAAMNPCPCGNYGSSTQPCRCTQKEIARYLGRISGPLLDRIDMQLEVTAVPVRQITESAPEEPSEAIHARVQAARKRQQARYAGEGVSSNAELSARQLEQFCPLDEACRELIGKACDKYNLSMRAVSRVRKVARTIADLAGEENIGKAHILEALRYRNLEGNYWK